MGMGKGASLNDSLMSNGSKERGAQSTDMMVLKRLNYLRNALENHSAKETTMYLRDNAEKKRDERILELWRQDMEKPTV